MKAQAPSGNQFRAWLDSWCSANTGSDFVSTTLCCLSYLARILGRHMMWTQCHIWRSLEVCRASYLWSCRHLMANSEHTHTCLWLTQTSSSKFHNFHFECFANRSQPSSRFSESPFVKSFDWAQLLHLSQLHHQPEQMMSWVFHLLHSISFSSHHRQIDIWMLETWDAWNATWTDWTFCACQWVCSRGPPPTTFAIVDLGQLVLDLKILIY